MTILEIFSLIFMILTSISIIYASIINAKIALNFDVYKINKRIKLITKSLYFSTIFSLNTLCFYFLISISNMTIHEYINIILWLIVFIFSANRYMYYNYLYNTYYMD